MGRIAIFALTTLLFASVGICIWWAWSRVYIAIKRRESVFEIEKETHKKIKEKVKEQEE